MSVSPDCTQEMGVRGGGCVCFTRVERAEGGRPRFDVGHERRIHDSAVLFQLATTVLRFRCKGGASTAGIGEV